MATCQIYNEDCVRGMAEHLPDDSVNLTVTSPPFEELFSYSGKTEDVGNNGSTINLREGRFALNLSFVAEQLLRVTKPGCNVCLHIQQLLAYKNQHGFMGRRDFRGAVIDLFRARGFLYVGEAAIGKDPQQMAQRLSLHSLQFKTGWGRTSTDWAMAPNDFVLVFQKPGEVEVPVRCLRDDRNPNGWVSKDEWIVWAKGVWEIDAFDVLDGARSKALKESDEEKHVCPLQLEVIRRLVMIYSNPLSVDPASVVLDPFMGIGSTAWMALGARSPHSKLFVGGPRNVVGFELKESYHRSARKNADRALALLAEDARPEADLFASLPSFGLPTGGPWPGEPEALAAAAEEVA